MRERVAAGLTTTFASSYAGQLSLVQALRPDAIAAYGRMATGTKYVLVPNGGATARRTSPPPPGEAASG
jgi:NADPH:quinone reductase